MQSLKLTYNFYLLIKIFKYTRNTNLWTPEQTDAKLCDEFEAIIKWAARNKVLKNISKT